ncbi:carboxymuconolactone decarboxylase family protein [Rhizosphaericola mali]|uniref:Carboxymuconolactone decarboxylase family protein n=1 Tax=Rhizosphaericola mali TaxID=2545455 RepID=A0A5P2FZ07_9BACT|nr:carboxymuconolactone decarboxylase family protein [Rhizosphaericola mali]QES88445.1 carboxymuconolactone decarboxylase family protein [Rhizosphaericola mali]
MKTINVPARDQVTEQNQHLFDNLKKMVGFVPNLYATFANSDNALANYLTLQSGKTSLSGKEKEIVNLVVSQYNQCVYCLSAHTQIAKMQGFTDEQIIEIRKADITFDTKFNALSQLVKSSVENKGHATPEIVDAFFEAGYNEGNLVDVVVLIGDKIITNYLYAITNIPVDWPLAPEI